MNELRTCRRRNQESLAPLAVDEEDLSESAGGSGVDDLSRKDLGQAHGGGRVGSCTSMIFPLIVVNPAAVTAGGFALRNEGWVRARRQDGMPHLRLRWVRK